MGVIEVGVVGRLCGFLTTGNVHRKSGLWQNRAPQGPRSIRGSMSSHGGRNSLSLPSSDLEGRGFAFQPASYSSLRVSPGACTNAVRNLRAARPVAASLVEAACLVNAAPPVATVLILAWSADIPVRLDTPLARMVGQERPRSENAVGHRGQNETSPIFKRALRP
jgi:hypothetical protein